MFLRRNAGSIMKKRILTITGLLILAGIIAGVLRLDILLRVATGYHAKILCSSVFISGRKSDDVKANELNFSLIKFVSCKVDTVRKSVTSYLLWRSSTAVYRQGYGTMLLPGGGDAQDRRKPFPRLPGPGYDPDTVPWPQGNRLPDNLQAGASDKLQSIADRLVEGHEFGGNPYAFIVLHRGVPVVERYKAGFTPATRFPAWSMAKSVTCSLAGLLVADGLLDTGSTTGIGAWKNDERRRITVKDLLQMQSGLEWNEDYGNLSDVTRMLFTSDDFARYTENKPPAHPAGTHWYYTSGTTNLLTSLMRRSFPSDSAYLAFPYLRLFYPLGVTQAVFETDPAGSFAGSSYLFATARDFARFGLLWLNDGVFDGKRILPEGWVRFATTPASHSGKKYGACFWLNGGGRYPSAPADMYFCIGVDGQRIFMVPSKDLVVVVLGYSHEPENKLNFDRLLGSLLPCFPG